MLLGMLQFGIYLSATNTLWNGAREGARVAAVQPSTLSTADADKQIADQVAKTIAPLERSKMTVTVTPKDASARLYGTAVTVRVSYDMSSRLFVPVPSYWFGKPLGKNLRHLRHDAQRELIPLSRSCLERAREDEERGFNPIFALTAHSKRVTPTASYGRSP